jgi:PII-like signaling protein
VSGECLKLTTYFSERTRSAGALLADRLLDCYEQHALERSVLLRGSAGFGAMHRPSSDSSLTLSEDLPAVSVAVDRSDRIEAALEDVLGLEHRGLVTLERARVLRPGEETHAADVPRGEQAKLTLYLARGERSDGRPAYVAATELLRDCGLAGATALLGVDGTRGRERTRAGFMRGNAGVPVMLIAVGDRGEVERALARLGELPSEPLATVERVQVCKRDGRLLAQPHALPATDSHGLALWQKLMIYTSQAATHEGAPVSTQLVRRLHEAGAAGATNLRGVWGYHGEHPPHGDRLLQVRRHVPVVTIVIDAPQRIARAFEVADVLTAEAGLVTTEMVPAAAAIGAHATAGGTLLAEHRY